MNKMNISKKENGEKNLTTLPPEIILTIMKMLPIKNRVALSETCLLLGQINECYPNADIELFKQLNRDIEEFNFKKVILKDHSYHDKDGMIDCYLDYLTTLKEKDLKNYNIEKINTIKTYQRLYTKSFPEDIQNMGNNFKPDILIQIYFRKGQEQYTKYQSSGKTIVKEITNSIKLLAFSLFSHPQDMETRPVNRSLFQPKNL